MVFFGKSLGVAWWMLSLGSLGWFAMNIHESALFGINLHDLSGIFMNLHELSWVVWNCLINCSNQLFVSVILSDVVHFLILYIPSFNNLENKVTLHLFSVLQYYHRSNFEFVTPVDFGLFCKHFPWRFINCGHMIRLQKPQSWIAETLAWWTQL